MNTSNGIEEEVTFTVPYLIPPTVNHYTRTCYYRGKDGASHKGKKQTPEAKAFKAAVAVFAQGRTVAPETPKERKMVRYAVRIDVYLGPRARGDFDNFWKCGLDALVGCGVIHSDAAVDGENSKCVVHKDQRDEPRTKYTVRQL
jgi:Holliday junction resolvase RusA-like endonuclease